MVGVKSAPTRVAKPPGEMPGAKLAEFAITGLSGPIGSEVSVKVAVGCFLIFLLKIAETVKDPPMGPADVTRVDAWPLTSAVTEVALDRKSTRLNSSHLVISYAVFCL